MEVKAKAVGEAEHSRQGTRNEARPHGSRKKPSANSACLSLHFRTFERGQHFVFITSSYNATC